MVDPDQEGPSVIFEPCCQPSGAYPSEPHCTGARTTQIVHPCDCTSGPLRTTPTGGQDQTNTDNKVRYVTVDPPLHPIREHNTTVIDPTFLDLLAPTTAATCGANVAQQANYKANTAWPPGLVLTIMLLLELLLAGMQLKMIKPPCYPRTMLRGRG